MAPSNLVPRVLSYPSPQSEGERVSESERENLSRRENLGMRLGTQGERANWV